MFCAFEDRNPYTILIVYSPNILYELALSNNKTSLSYCLFFKKQIVLKVNNVIKIF